MSTLFIIWLVALFVLSSTLAYAHIRMKRVHTFAQARVPNDFSEFIAQELHDISLHLRRAAHVMRPHGKQAVGYAVLLSRRGYDMFTERVFGRMEVTKGKTTSFFLKHISENKENRDRGEDIPVQ